MWITHKIVDNYVEMWITFVQDNYDSWFERCVFEMRLIRL